MTTDHNAPHVNDTDDNGNEVPNTNAGEAAETTGDPTKLTIKFRFSGGAEVQFVLKFNTKLGKAMDAFAAKTERDRGTLRFMFEGERILDDTTPESLEMVDGDVVEVYTEQIGGGVVPGKGKGDLSL